MNTTPARCGHCGAIHQLAPGQRIACHVCGQPVTHAAPAAQTPRATPVATVVRSTGGAAPVATPVARAVPVATQPVAPQPVAPQPVATQPVATQPVAPPLSPHQAAPYGQGPPLHVPPGFAPPGFAPPGFAPPGFAPPGVAPPGFAPPPGATALPSHVAQAMLPPHLQGARLGFDEPEPAPAKPSAQRAAPARRAHSGSGMVMFYVFLGVVLLGGGVIVLALARPTTFNLEWSRDGDAPAEPSQQYIENHPREVVWTDALRSLRLNNVAVRVARVDYGEVRARDNTGAVIVSDQKNLLTIQLEIGNHGAAPLHYKSWYGNTFSVAKVAAELYDQNGRQFQMLTFTDVRAVRGHIAEATIERRKEARDVLIFVIPEEIGINSVESFRLALPAAAVGANGFYRFEIPLSMVQQADDVDLPAPMPTPTPTPAADTPSDQ